MSAIRPEKRARAIGVPSSADRVEPCTVVVRIAGTSREATAATTAETATAAAQRCEAPARTVSRRGLVGARLHAATQHRKIASITPARRRASLARP